MAVPKFSEFYSAILQIAYESSQSKRSDQFKETVCQRLRLSDNEIAEKTSSGMKTKVEDRTRWAIYHLQKDGLLESPSRGLYRISAKGKASPRHQYRTQNTPQAEKLPESESHQIEPWIKNLPKEVDEFGLHDSTPDEKMAIHYEEQRERLAQEILDIVKGIAPSEFEKLVVELLKGMGYGDGKVTGKSGDGGIDGVLNQDALGMEKIYIQAKRFDYAQVGEPEIRNFSGSLDPHGANKGIFITTSSFSANARRTSENISRGGKIIRLIEGTELAQLMIQHGVGVVTEITYEVKKLDANYFADL
ncbi:MAG: restriction endonuclease [Chloroflexi bacterium]|nr:restriction endonuclease [Chloroflexota bacterium]